MGERLALVEDGIEDDGLDDDVKRDVSDAKTVSETASGWKIVRKICSREVVEEPDDDFRCINQRMKRTRRLPKRMIDQPLDDQNLLMAAMIMF